MQTQTSNAEKARRAAQAARYAPRKKLATPAPRAKSQPESVELRKLTGKVLDELKKPGVVPSQVILAALVEAQLLAKQR